MNYSFHDFGNSAVCENNASIWLDSVIGGDANPGCVNASAQRHNAIHVVVHIANMCYAPLFEYEAFKLGVKATSWLPLVRVCKRIDYHLSCLYFRLECTLVAELRVVSEGPRSIVLRKTKLDYYGFTFATLQKTLMGTPLFLHFFDMDSLIVRCRIPRIPDLVAPETSSIETRRFDYMLLRAAAILPRFVQELTPNVSFVFNLTSLNLRASWGLHRWWSVMDHYVIASGLSTHDIVSRLRSWGDFESGDEVSQISMFTGPPIVSQIFMRQVDILSISSFRELDTMMPLILNTIRHKMRRVFSGWRYLSKSMAVFSLMLHNSEFPSNQYFAECLTRLGLGGILHFKLDMQRDRLVVDPVFPMLREQMASVLNVRSSLLEELESQASKLRSTCNSLDVWQRWILLELLQISSHKLWRWLYQTRRLEPIFSELPRLIVVQSENQSLSRDEPDVGPISRPIDFHLNTVYALVTPSTKYNLCREFALVAGCRGKRCSILLRLLHAREADSLHIEVVEVLEYAARPDGDHYMTRAEGSSAENPSMSELGARRSSATSMRALLRFGKSSAVSQDELFISGPRTERSEALSEPSIENLPYTCAGNALFDRIFKDLRIKTPWYDMSSRSRVYNHYMCGKLKVRYASGRMALRQQKATGLSYMANAEEVVNQLDVSRYELSLYRAYSVSVGSRLEIPETKSVKSVRVLIKLLIAWGTDVAEVIETRKLLKRNRIFWLDKATQPDRIIESSQLALGTKLAVKAVLRSVRSPAMTRLL